MSSILDIFSSWCLRDMQVVKQIKMNVWHSDTSSRSYLESHKDVKVTVWQRSGCLRKGERAEP